MPRNALRRCCQNLAPFILIGAAAWLPPGCSEIDNLQRTQNVLATLAEADRQFSIESTAAGQYPDDSAPKRWISNAIALMPHSDVPYLGTNDAPGLIAILENRGRYPLLIDYLKTAIRDPKLANNYHLLLALADAEERMGPQADAARDYASALVQINKSFTSAGFMFGAGGDDLLDRARAEYYGGQRAQAIKDFNTIITTRPELASVAKNNLAYFYALDKSDLPDAKKLATAALDDARRSGDDEQIGSFADTLAWTYHQAGDDEDALDYEQEAASLTPLEPDVQYHLGLISQAKGQTFQARVAYNKAIKLDPFFPEARAALSSLSPAALPPRAS